MEIVFVIVALAVGFAVGYLVERVGQGKLRSQIDVLRARLSDAGERAAEAAQQAEASHRAALAEKDRTLATMLAEKDRLHVAELERQRQATRDQLDALQGRFDETVARMKAEIESLTGEMLKRRQEEFETSSRESVARILQPLNASIEGMQRAVAENTMKHTEYGGRLDANLRMVLEHSDAARKSADRLADALRGGGKIQGDWGETVLTELLESQGLTEGVHFKTQYTMRDADGSTTLSDSARRLRPDVVLSLDRDREVVIDAKVSLSAYLDYMQAETEEKRTQALKAHVRSIENHVAELVTKNYSQYVSPGKESIGYVIMFVPNTSALYAATSQKPDLWRKAMEKGVYIADEQTLYAALKIISMTWRQIHQAENHEEVYKLANEMLTRVGQFMEKFLPVGRKLEEAQKAFEDAYGKLRESGQSIPVTCRKLVKLGAKSDRQRKLPTDISF